MLASLQVGQIKMGHSLCGAWGCGPPTEALLAMHLFWFSALLPPALLAIRYLNFSPKFWFRSGMFLLGVAVAGMVGLLAYDLSVNHYYYQAGYWWQRYGLSFLSLVEAPIIPTLVIGLTYVVTGRASHSTNAAPAPSPSPEIETTPAS